MSFTVFMPTKWIFGAGALDELKNQTLPGGKALIVTSNGKSVKENGSLNRVIESLDQQDTSHHLFDEVEANPLKSTVMRGAAVARDNGCDFIVAVGGGSVMDASKAIAAMTTNDGDLWDYINGGTGKGKMLKNTPLPIVAITTTAGTGSEVDQWGVVSNDETNEKIGFGGYDSLFPVLAIVDPELMKTVPPQFTAYQGFDALFHSTEVYISKFANPFSDMVALTAIQNAAQNLAAAVQDGANIEAREKVAFANTLSGYSMVTGCCTSEHSMEHAMSAYHHSLPHGAGLIMLSKAYYRHFVDIHACDSRFVDMAKAMGNPNADKPQDFITALENLQEACGVADLKMSDYGIVKSEFKTLAKNARETMGGLFASDPMPLSEEDCIKIFEQAWK